MVLLLGLVSLLAAQGAYPKVYGSVGDDLFAAADGYARLLQMPDLKRIHRDIAAFTTEAKRLQEVGFSLEKKSDADGYNTYLADLRRLAKKKHSLDARYLKVVHGLKVRHIEVDLAALRQNPYPFIQEAAVSHERSEAEGTDRKEDASMDMQASLEALRTQLMQVREEGNETMTGCLNDITAINYWILKVEMLRVEKEWCSAYDATGHIVDFERSAKRVCGAEHPLYLQWKEHSLDYREALRKELKEACTQE